MKILFVENDKITARTIGRILSILGHDVTNISTASEALQTIVRGPTVFDLIISDFDTGKGLSGLDLLRAVRRDPVTRDKPFILATGNITDEGDQSLSEICKSLSAVFLHKPYMKEDLEEAIEKFL